MCTSRSRAGRESGRSLWTARASSIANARRAERAEVVEEHRHVEVDAPLARAGSALPGLDRILEIEVARQLAVSSSRASVSGRSSRRSALSTSTTSSVTSGCRTAAASCSLKIGIPASTSFCERGRHVLELDRLVADVEHDAEVAAEGHVGLGDGDACELGQSPRSRRRSRDVRGSTRPSRRSSRGSSTARARSQASPCGRCGLEVDEMGGHAKHVLGVAGDDSKHGDVRLEAQRRGLDRRATKPSGDDVGEHVRDVHRVAASAPRSASRARTPAPSRRAPLNGPYGNALTV